MKRGLRSLLSVFIIAAFVLGQIVPAYSKDAIQPTVVSGQEELNSLEETALQTKQRDGLNEVNLQEGLYPQENAVSMFSADDHGNDFDKATAVSMDVEINGMIDSPRDIDYFKFKTSSSGDYMIEGMGNLNIDCFLYNSNKQFLTGNGRGKKGNIFYMGYNFAEDTEYYIVVNNNVHSNSTGPYSIKITKVSDDHGHGNANATVIPLETEVQGNISFPCDNDVFKFTPEKSGRYVIESFGYTDTMGILYQINSDGSARSLNGNDDANSTNKNFYIGCRLEENTTYSIHVSHGGGDYHGTGNYSIKVYIEEGGGFSTAINIVADKDIGEEIKNENQEVYYRFIPSVTGSYVIDIRDISCEMYELNCELFDSNKDWIMPGLVRGVKDNFHISSTMTAGKEYYITLTNFSSRTIKYSIKITNVEDDFSNIREDAKEIQVGTEVNGEINFISDTDTFIFIPKVSGNYVIESLGETDTAAAIFGIINGGGGINSNSDANNTNKNFYAYNELTANALYYIIVSYQYDVGDEIGTGAYRLKVHMEEGEDFSTALNVVEDKDVDGEIKNRGQNVFYKFTPSVTGSYVIESIGNTDVDGYIYNSSREIISCDKGGIRSNFYIAASFNANTEYYIKVQHADKYSGTGKYNLKIRQEDDDFTNDHINAVDIMLDSEIKGSINYGRDTDVFRFTPSVTGSYVIESIGNTNVEGYIYNSSMETISYDYNGGIGSNFCITASLNADSQYYIKVQHANNYSGTGKYNLKIRYEKDDFANDHINAGEIKLDSEIKGSINYGRDTDIFRFTPSEDGNYVFERTSDADIKCVLYDNNNNNTYQITSEDIGKTSYNFYLSAKLLARNTYYIEVSHKDSTDLDTAGIGNYGLKVYKGEDRHGNSFDTATEISVGKNIDCELNYSGDIDYLKFTPSVSGKYTIESDGNAGFYTYLYNSNRIYLAYAKNTNGKNFRIVHYLNANETYYLMANSSKYIRYKVRVYIGSEDNNQTQTQQISNSSFNNNTSGWNLWTQDGAIATGTRDTSVYDSSPGGYRIDCTNKGTQFNHIQLFTSGLNIEKDKFYELSFRAKTKGGKATPEISFMKRLSPWTYYSKAVNLSIGEEWNTFTVYFKADTTDTKGRITFFLGNRMTEGSSLYIDSVSFKKFVPAQLISNTSFDYDTNGWSLWTQNEASAIGQRDPTCAYRIDCNSKGSGNNQIQLITAGLNIKAGKKYELIFDAKGEGGNIEPLIMLMKKDSPWTSYGTSSSVKIGSKWNTYKVQFTSNTTDSDGRITFFLGNRMLDGSKLYLDNISLIELP